MVYVVEDSVKEEMEEKTMSDGVGDSVKEEIEEMTMGNGVGDSVKEEIEERIDIENHFPSSDSVEDYCARLVILFHVYCIIEMNYQYLICYFIYW